MNYDLIVIGGGPAGLSAAITAGKNDVKVAVIDENTSLGGKLLGQLYEDPDEGWWIGQDVAKRLADEATALGVDLYTGEEVWGVFPEWKVNLSSGNQLKSDYIVLATGSAEHANPLPGWTTPGVMAIGAAQTLNNYYRVKPGKKVAIIGVDPLSMTVAHELQMSGVDVTGIYLPYNEYFSIEKSHPERVMKTLMGLAHLAPSRFLQLGKHFKNSQMIQSIASKFFPTKGITVWGIPLHLKTAVNAIYGEKSVKAIQTINLTAKGDIISGSEDIVEVDAVCISGRLYPLTELASAIGCQFTHIKELGGHIPIHSSELETTIDNVFVAGNITGIESAKVAIAQGELAGTVISSRLQKITDSETIENAKAKVINERDMALLQFQDDIDLGRLKQQQSYDNYIIAKKNAEVT